MSNLAVTLTIEQMEAMMERAAAKALSRSRAAADPEPVMTREETAKFLKCDPQTIPKLVRDDGLPGHHCGKEWRFYRQEVVAWLLSKSARKGE